MLVLDEVLPLGLPANAAVLAATLGEHRPDVVDADLPNVSGYVHPSIIPITLPVPCASRAEIARLLR